MTENASGELSHYISIRQAAASLALSERKIWLWLRSGELRAYRFGRATRVAVHDLEALTAKAAAQALPSAGPARPRSPKKSARAGRA